MEVHLKHPFTMIVAGPTACGKSMFVSKLIELSSIVCYPSPVKITYCYGEWQPLFLSMKNVNFIEGLPNEILTSVNGQNSEWLIIDDLMHESSNSKLITDLFVKGSHHKNLSVILIVQNLFSKGKEFRTISLNSHYIVLFKNPRDMSVIYSIAKQVLPSGVKFLTEAYFDATRKPFSYLFLNLKQDTDDRVRFISNVLNEGTMIAYNKK